MSRLIAYGLWTGQIADLSRKREQVGAERTWMI